MKPPVRVSVTGQLLADLGWSVDLVAQPAEELRARLDADTTDDLRGWIVTLRAAVDLAGGRWEDGELAAYVDGGRWVRAEWTRATGQAEEVRQNERAPSSRFMVCPECGQPGDYCADPTPHRPLWTVDPYWRPHAALTPGQAEEVRRHENGTPSVPNSDYRDGDLDDRRRMVRALGGQQAVARLLGVSQSVVSRRLHGHPAFGALSAVWKRDGVAGVQAVAAAAAAEPEGGLWAVWAMAEIALARGVVGGGR